MLYHNIINTHTQKRLSKYIIEQQMIYQIKGGFYEKIQKSNRNKQQNTRKNEKDNMESNY